MPLRLRKSATQRRRIDWLDVNQNLPQRLRRRSVSRQNIGPQLLPVLEDDRWNSPAETWPFTKTESGDWEVTR